MPHLTALAIEGALLDADEDWLRDMAGLMRHGRWVTRCQLALYWVCGLWVAVCCGPGGGLDGKEDWLRDMVGLLRHGR
jgi:hypothetical protein